MFLFRTQNDKNTHMTKREREKTKQNKKTIKNKMIKNKKGQKL
jgi:hypothetical protein